MSNISLLERASSVRHKMMCSNDSEQSRICTRLSNGEHSTFWIGWRGGCHLPVVASRSQYDKYLPTPGASGDFGTKRSLAIGHDREVCFVSVRSRQRIRSTGFSSPQVNRAVQLPRRPLVTLSDCSKPTALRDESSKILRRQPKRYWAVYLEGAPRSPPATIFSSVEIAAV